MMFVSANIVRARIEAVPSRISPDSTFRRVRRWFATFCALTAGMLSFGAMAQITEPLLPYAVPSAVPQLPAPPGEQVISPGQTVINRPRPQYDPIGLRVGDFFWFPRGEVDEAYNSNIFATTNSPTHDFITNLQPSFDLLSIFPRNTLNLHGTSAFQLYANNPAQNTQDGTINVDGRLDVTAGSSFYGNAQVAHQHISYGSPNSPGGIAQPVTYWDYIARAGYAQTGRRFTYQVDIGTESAQYNAVPLTGGGVLPYSSSDVTISEAALRAGYELIPDYVGYVRVAGDLYNYWHTVPGNPATPTTPATPGGVRPNSTVYRVDLGLQILPRHIIYGEAYAGYLVQNFALSSLGSTSAPDYGGRLVWNVTRLTTLTFNGARAFIAGTPSSPSLPSPASAGNGYLASTVTVNGDHELLRNLLVNVNAGYENDSFQGITRTDNVFTAGAGLKYLVNRNLFLGGFYSYYQRNSTLSGISYTQNIVMLRLGTQF
jgi:hypothetical protein